MFQHRCGKKNVYKAALAAQIEEKVSNRCSILSTKCLSRECTWTCYYFLFCFCFCFVFVICFGSSIFDASCMLYMLLFPFFPCVSCVFSYIFIILCPCHVFCIFIYEAKDCLLLLEFNSNRLILLFYIVVCLYIMRYRIGLLIEVVLALLNFHFSIGKIIMLSQEYAGNLVVRILSERKKINLHN
jgi:hypothetical protein